MASSLRLEFPTTTGPFTTTATDRIAAALNAYYKQYEYPKPDPTSSKSSMAGLNPSTAGMGRGDILFCQLSPLHEITLNDEAKAAANIPREAAHFAWAYPEVRKPGSGRQRESSPEGAFLEFGGYVYFNDDVDAVGATSLRPAAMGALGLNFSRPHVLAEGVEKALDRQGRFQEITLADLARKGATQFAWIRPDEFRQRVFCPDGAFAYKFAEGPPKYFAVVSKPVFTRELLAEELDETETWVVVRDAFAEPYLETLMIFDKKKSLHQNLDSLDPTSGFMVAPAMTGAYVTKDSQPKNEMTYQDWSSSPGQGTIADPWIIHMVNESFSVIA